MSRRLLVAALVLLAPAVARAQDAPERLLGASTQLYLRWDGVEAHSASYQKTALGKMLQEDTGKFLGGVYRLLENNLAEQMTVPQLLAGIDPVELQKLQDYVAEAPKLVPVLTKNGFVLAAELRGIEPPQLQVTLILPGAGADPKPFQSLLRLIANQNKLEIKEAKIAARQVSHIDTGFVQVTWWTDDKDAVLVVGTDKPEEVVKRAVSKEDRIADNTQFKRVREFKDFETAARGYLDGSALLKVARSRKDVSKILDGLGLDNLHAARFYLGFDVPAERGLLEIDMPGPRKGLLDFANQKPFKLADVPPLPDDVLSFTALKFSALGVYDTSVKVTESVLDGVFPFGKPIFQAGLKQVNDKLGFNLRNDMLAALGDTVVVYNSNTDGPVNLGAVVMFQAKDAKKLNEAIDKFLKVLPELIGMEVKVNKRTYRKAEVCEVAVKQQGFIFLPTYTVHNGWLAVSFFPQPVQGYILRADGEVPAWKPGPAVETALDKMPKEYTLLSVSDPRPSVKQVLSISPLIGAAVRNFAPDSKFDVGAIPNGHQATRHLFPNVTTLSDDGSTLRLQTRSSFQVPFDIVGLDSYAGMFFILQLLRF